MIMVFLDSYIFTSSNFPPSPLLLCFTWIGATMCNVQYIFSVCCTDMSCSVCVYCFCVLLNLPLLLKGKEMYVVLGVKDRFHHWAKNGIIRCHIVSCCVVLYRIVLYGMVRYHIVLYHVVWYYITLFHMF